MNSFCSNQQTDYDPNDFLKPELVVITTDYSYLLKDAQMHTKVVSFMKAGFRQIDLYNVSLRYLEQFGKNGLLNDDYKRLMNWSENLI